MSSGGNASLAMATACSFIRYSKNSAINLLCSLLQATTKLFRAILDQVKEQLIQITLPRVVDCIDCESDKGGHVVNQAFGLTETQWIPAGIAELLETNRVDIRCKQRLIVLRTLAAMPVVGEVFRLRCAEDPPGFLLPIPGHKPQVTQI